MEAGKPMRWTLVFSESPEPFRDAVLRHDYGREVAYETTTTPR